MLILQRMRQNSSQPGPLDQNLVGPYAKVSKVVKRPHGGKTARYLALHLRFEIDMVAHSLCEFGGGGEERRELEAYRQIHFPSLTLINKSKKLPSPAVLREEGLCPLAPEEAGLMLAALGFNRKTHIFLAGAQIYGGRSRLAALSNLYPNLVTKEDLLSPSEIAPFSNFSSQVKFSRLVLDNKKAFFFVASFLRGCNGSFLFSSIYFLCKHILKFQYSYCQLLIILTSRHTLKCMMRLVKFLLQLAALDYIGCTAASAFAMTDSGSQLSALVSGYRIYYGGGEMMTIRPNKRRLANIFLKNSTIEWKIFEQRVRKAVRQTKQIHSRPLARSIYRHPCSKECMCRVE
ncbi:O-fucosyltransferase 15-like protein [Drosera capensis]